MMTLAQLIAAFRELSPEDQRRFLAEVKPKRGRPRKGYDAKLTEARDRIARVEAKMAELGSLEDAFLALATTKQSAGTLADYYKADKRFVYEASFDDIFEVYE